MQNVKKFNSMCVISCFRRAVEEKKHLGTHATEEPLSVNAL
jgi:hypothetical protein